MAMILFFYTISIIPLGEAITLNKTSPFFVTILAFFLLAGRVNVEPRSVVRSCVRGLIFEVKSSREEGAWTGH